MGGFLAVLQDHPVSDYRPDIFQAPAQDKGATPILKDIVHAFFFCFRSVTILHSPLTTDELAVVRVARDCLHGLHYTLRKKVTNPGPQAPKHFRGGGRKTCLHPPKLGPWQLIENGMRMPVLNNAWYFFHSLIYVVMKSLTQQFPTFTCVRSNRKGKFLRYKGNDIATCRDRGKG